MSKIEAQEADKVKEKIIQLSEPPVAEEKAPSKSEASQPEKDEEMKSEEKEEIIESPKSAKEEIKSDKEE